MSKPRKLDTIREQQIEEMAHGLGVGPSALVRVVTDNKGIGLAVWLFWKKDRPLQLLALSGRPRVFRHFGRLLKWAAAHEVIKVEMESIELSEEVRKALGQESSESEEESSDDANAGKPSIDFLDQDKQARN